MTRTPLRLVSVFLLALAFVGAACEPQAPSPTSTPTEFTFSGGGFGHGVGMSQYGAYGRAKAGHTASAILSAYYPGTAVQTRSLGNIRVHLADTASTDYTSTATITVTDTEGKAITTVNPNETLAVRNSAGAVQLQVVAPTKRDPITRPAGQAIYLSTPGDTTLRLAATGRHYRHGRILVKPLASANRHVLRDLTVDQYLYGLGEMPASWPLEALKAQAIAGRTYAARRIQSPRSADYDILSTVSDQAYTGTSVVDGASGSNWKAAVDQTSGKVLTYNGGLAETYYSSSNGGYSEAADYVWTAKLAYLRAEPDPFDGNSANGNAKWTRTYTARELGTWIEKAGRGKVGTVTSIKVGGNVGKSGRIDKATVTVTGTSGTVTMTGNQLRSAINSAVPSSRQLRSTRFSITPVGGTVTASAAKPTTTTAKPPADTTPPDLRFITQNPLRYGDAGNICAIVTSNEPTIYSMAIRLDGVEVKSPVAGVGPEKAGGMCWQIPSKLRTTRARKATIIAVGFDAAVNYRTVTAEITVQK